MTFLFESAMIDEEDLRDRARELLKSQAFCDMDFAWLKSINGEYGTDIATMVYFEWAQPKYESFMENVRKSAFGSSQKIKILILPTMYYWEHPELGGDALVVQHIARKLQLDVEVIPIHSLGSVANNAERIIDFIQNEPCESLWLVSVSKGSADLKRALILAPELILPKVKGWISLAGMLRGTPLTDKGIGKPINPFLLKQWIKFRGGEANIMDEMGKRHAYSVENLFLPKECVAISIVALPLLSHLRKPVVKPYTYLSQYGPNDGYVLLEDSLLPSAHVVPFWGADHYFRTPQLSSFFNIFLKSLVPKT